MPAKDRHAFLLGWPNIPKKLMQSGRNPASVSTAARILTRKTPGHSAAAEPRYLMCPPRYFSVTYSINPWMNPQQWANDGTSLHKSAQEQWAGLCEALMAAGATIEILPPVPGLPDLVFTANAAVVLNGKAVLARFKHGEREGEEPVFAAEFEALRARGALARVTALPQGIRLEGAGDCIWDMKRQVFWMGSGFRSDAAAATSLSDALGAPCLVLALADPRFYHLDTAFCPLPCGSVIYYPEAFTAVSREVIHVRVAPEQRIALDLTDATHFAANAVCVGRSIVLSRASTGLRHSFQERGYAVVETPLDVFQRAGGSACCLTLRLDYRSAAVSERAGGRLPGAGTPELSASVTSSSR